MAGWITAHPQLPDTPLQPLLRLGLPLGPRSGPGRLWVTNAGSGNSKAGLLGCFSPPGRERHGAGGPAARSWDLCSCLQVR